MQRSTSHLLFDLRLHVCVLHAARPAQVAVFAVLPQASRPRRHPCCAPHHQCRPPPPLVARCRIAAAPPSQRMRCSHPAGPLLRRAPPPSQAQRTSRANESGPAAAASAAHIARQRKRPRRRPARWLARTGGMRCPGGREAPKRQTPEAHKTKRESIKMPSRDSCVSSGGAARANAMPRAALHEGSAAAAAAAAVHAHARTRRCIERGRLRRLSHVACEPSGGAAPAPTPAPLLRAACVQRRVWYVCYCASARVAAGRAHTINRTRRGSCRCRSVAVRASAVRLGGARWSCMDVSGLRLPADRYIYIYRYVRCARARVCWYQRQYYQPCCAQ